MATNKKAAEAAKNADGASSSQARYELALDEFGGALQLLHKGEFQQALDRFREIEAAHPDEPTLIDRARTYATICANQLAQDDAEPGTGEEKYYRAVLSLNDGKYDEALLLFESALNEMPESPKVLYARASAWALKGNAEAAVGDLRRAIATDPQVRFHAANDPDFEPIREEPSFIDIIEPTPSGG